MARQERPPRGPVAALGALSLVCFGSWFYGFGILLEPIREDTGWAESTLTSTYGVSLLLTGMGAAVAGGIIDRRGGRRLLLGSGLVAGTALLASSYAGSAGVFAVTAAVGGGVTGASGYYHATQAVIGRIAPQARTRGMTAMTLWGAFSSPVFLPLLGWAVLGLGWRPTMRLLAGAVATAFTVAALSIPGDVAAPADGSRRPTVLTAWRLGARDPRLRRLYLAGMAAGLGTSVLLLYQVPAMVAAGLTLATASGLAGARGVVQLGGRLPLPPVIRRIGARRSLRASMVLAAVGALLLPGAGDLPTALAFTLVAGIAIGALPAVEGIYAGEITDLAVLGTTLGAYSLLRGIGAAVGPVLGGLLTDLTGSRGTALVVSATALLAAGAMLGPAGEPSGDGRGQPDGAVGP